MKQTLIRSTFFAMVMLFVGGMSPVASAQAKGYVGGLVGMSVPDADDTSSRPIFGLLGGARLDGEFGLGGYYMSSKKDETGGEFGYKLYGIEGSFHFEGVADGAFVAVRIGVSKVEGGSVSFSPMNYGLYFGYDHMLTEAASVGIEAGFSKVDKDSKSDGSELESFGILNFAATGKFWF